MVAEISVAVSATQAIIISDLSGSQAPAWEHNFMKTPLRLSFPSRSLRRRWKG